MRMATELFNAYLDGHELTSEQSRFLSDWVKQSPENARSLILLAQIHESLDSCMCVPRMLEDLTSIEDPETREEISESLEAFVRKIEEVSPLSVAVEPPRQSRPWAWGGGLAVAASLFVLLLVRPAWRGAGDVADPGVHESRSQATAQADGASVPAPGTGQSSESRPAQLVATLSQAIDAEWNDAVGRAAGAELLQGEAIDLKAGIVSLSTTVGHSIVIEGPARLVVHSPQLVAIERGKAVGRVGIHGGSLKFSTPTATIRDLGTEFGVEVAEDRHTSVAVYEGAIELVGKAEGAGEAIRLEAGSQRDVSFEGRVLEGDIPLQHDRHFVRLDEVALRVAGQHGDSDAESLAAYYALLRSGKLLAYQDFHTPSQGSERTIGLGEPRIRSAARVVLGEDLNPGSRLAAGGIRVETETFIFLPLDNSDSSRLARHDLLNAQGYVGKDGTEIWVAWREQLAGATREPKEFGGVSLTVNESDDSFDTYFGRVHEQGTVGVQFNRANERLKHHLDMAPQLPGVQKGDADGRAHRWVVHVKFAAGSDQIRVWLDVPPTEIEGRKPHFDMSRDNVEFDRVRFAKTAITDPWLFDEVMLAASLDDLMAADEIINE